MVKHFEEIHEKIQDVQWGTVRYLNTSVGTAIDKFVCYNEFDIRANNKTTGDVVELRLISGSGTPGSATGSLSSAGTLYIDTNGTGQLWMKTSQVNGSWDNISLNDGVGRA